MNVKRILLVSLLTIFVSSFAFADTVSINHFVIKENPFAKDEIAVVATDSLNNIRENVSGVFSFTVNGFDEALTFDKGTAFYRHKLDKSTFLYVKHVNESGTHSNLYYAFKHDNKIDTIHVSWILLLVIPILLVVLAYVFKRFVIIAIILFCVFLYFNHHNGLSIPTFFESIIDGLKALFH
jgi:hypothetical protein